MSIRTCPACGRDSPSDRLRCYNCNASLEREPVREGPRASESPTEKRTRPAVDLWKDEFKPQTDKIAVDHQAGEDAPGSFNRARTKSMAADVDQFQPQRRAGRGSSGDPSEIAPPTRSHSDMATPGGRPKPKSGEFQIRPPTTARSKDSTGIRRPPSTVESTPVPEGPLLEPKRRKPPTSAFEKVSLPSDGPGPGHPPDERPDTHVLDAVAAANEAAKTRKPLDPAEVAQLSTNLNDLDDSSSAEPTGAPMFKMALTETTADENPGASAIARAKAQVPDVQGGPHMPHYLVTQVLGEPVALARNQVVRIGRGEDNEVIFPLSQVSRHHAEVRFDPQAGSFVIIDRNSINGTFVNGKAVKRRRLADGDRIGIGPFTIVYRASTGGHKLRPMDETDVIRPGSLAGEISDMPMPDVARFIEALRKTGELTVLAATGERGIVLFRDGNPVHAEFKITLGPAAAVALFRIKAGNFRFSVKPIELAKVTITQSLTALLSEAANAPT